MFDLFGARRKQAERCDEVLGQTVMEVCQWIEELGERNELAAPPEFTALGTSATGLVAAAYMAPITFARANGNLDKRKAIPYIEAVGRFFKGADVGVESVRQGGSKGEFDFSSKAVRDRLTASYQKQATKMEAYTEGYRDFMSKGPGCGAGVLLCEMVTLDVYGEKMFDPIFAMQVLDLPRIIAERLS